jgi:hypothetical protein
VAKNLYADVVAFRRYFMHESALDTGDAAEVERVLEGASRRVEGHILRHVFSETKTVVLDGSGCRTLRIPDLLSATSIKLDEDGNRTFELVLDAATDYYLTRDGYEDESALPATMLVLDAINGQRSAFSCQRRLVEIVGRFGFTELTETVEASGTAITGTLADAVDLTLAVSAAADLAIGQTLKLENEQVYISGGSASPFTVVRGVNGTTAAGHAAVAVNRYVYPPEIRQATMILAGRTWARRESAYSNAISNPVIGQVEVWRAIDPDVMALLAPFVRGDRLVA